jgi:NAD(P)-dependent dehydrogenase (short-subunit alcohol dehydrogenase family)
MPQPNSKAPNKRYDGAFKATLNGLLDNFRQRGEPIQLLEDHHVQGKKILVSGASAGLGLAIAKGLAQRGAELVLLCRSKIEETRQIFEKLRFQNRVHIHQVDLSDFGQIIQVCQDIKRQHGELDTFIFNAAVVPAHDRKTPQGLEQMYAVNYFAKFVLLKQIQELGIIPKDRESRFIFISSESHRSGKDIDAEKLADYRTFKMSEVVGLYGTYKLALNKMAVQWQEEIQSNYPKAHFMAICPGPVNSSIGRDAPGWAKPIMAVVFSLFFASPAKAAVPVLYLASHNLKNQDFLYLHKKIVKQMDERSYEASSNKTLWDESNKLYEKLLKS